MKRLILILALAGCELEKHTDTQIMDLVNAEKAKTMFCQEDLREAQMAIEDCSTDARRTMEESLANLEQELNDCRYDARKEAAK